MKKTSILIPLFCVFFMGKLVSQVDSVLTKPINVDSLSLKTPAKKPADTLFTRTNEKIVCKVLEIGVTEIRYKKADFLEGPTFIIEKARVNYIVFAGGVRDEIQQEQPSQVLYQAGPTAPGPMRTINKTKAIKIEPFSPISGRIILGYEHVLKTGFNLEGKIGYVNSTYLKNNLYGSSYYYYKNSLITGGFFKGGIKFTFEQEYQHKGEWVEHPLKGHYLRINGLVTKFNVTYDNGFYYNSNGNSVPYPTTNLSISAYGLMGDYGYQFVIGNIVTLDLYIGLGYVAYNRASNISQYNLGSQYPWSGYFYTSPNYYSHTALSSYMSDAGIGFNTGMSVGIAF